MSNCHHAAAPTYRTALVHLGFLPPADASDSDNDDAPDAADIEQMERDLANWDRIAPRDRLLVGVTATPNRSDAIGLGCVFQSIAYSYALKDAIADGWLVPITPWVVETTARLDEVRMNRGDFNQRELADAVNTQDRNQLAVASWQKYAPGQSTIAFTVDVNHAHALAETFRASGVRAAAVSGETPREERRDILRQFQEGRITVVTNCMVLTEGTDLPIASCILHAKPTKSATLYEQMTGRGLRLYPGKAECIVIDLVDIARKHSLMAAPVLYGLPPGIKSEAGKKLHQIADELEAFSAKHPGFNLDKLGRVSLEQLAVQARTFDIWNVPTLGAFGQGRALNWVKVTADTFRQQYPWGDGVEVVSIAPDLLGQFAVTLTLRPNDGSPARQRVIASGLQRAEEGADVAEKFILTERREVTKLTAVDAPWRSQPASAKQIKFLMWKGCPVHKGITKGEAADKINRYRAQQEQV